MDHATIAPSVRGRGPWQNITQSISFQPLFTLSFFFHNTLLPQFTTRYDSSSLASSSPRRSRPDALLAVTDVELTHLLAVHDPGPDGRCDPHLKTSSARLLFLDTDVLIRTHVW